jgi:transglutaminase-like putative cysteine protease
MSMRQYLAATEIIDWDHASIRDLAALLEKESRSDRDTAKKCFEWVRDNIRHSCDYQLNPVTCRASGVLEHKTGYCYAKSHLLAALLRANGIPAGFCYQRLSRDGAGAPYCLHGLNAVYLEEYGWYRIDARGNKPGVEALFCPPHEKLAFEAALEKEKDLPEIWAEPLSLVVDTLKRCKTYEDVYNNLPVLELIYKRI